MYAVRTFAALSIAALATACASPGQPNAGPHATGMAPMTMGASGAMAAMDPRMKTMHEMHQKMSKAGTPAERQALMADHMKAMQGGMAMMKEMHAMHAGKGMPADMAQRNQMMTDHMAMMQMMMDMMASRTTPAVTGH